MTRMTCPVTYCASSLASHAASGELRPGPSGDTRPIRGRVGLEQSPAPGHRAGDPGEPGRADGVDRDAHLVELEGEGQGEADDRRLGGGVAGLAEVAAEAGTRRGVDDPAGEGLARLGLVTPVLRGVVRDVARCPSRARP